MGEQEYSKSPRPDAPAISREAQPESLLPIGASLNNIRDSIGNHSVTASLDGFDATFGITNVPRNGLFPQNDSASGFGLNRIGLQFRQQETTLGAPKSLNEPWAFAESPLLAKLNASLATNNTAWMNRVFGDLGIAPVEAMIFLKPGQESGFLTLAHDEATYQIAGGRDTPLRMSVVNSSQLGEFTEWLNAGARLSSISLVTDGQRVDLEPVVLYDSQAGFSASVGQNIDSIIDRLTGKQSMYNHRFSGQGFEFDQLGDSKKFFSLNSYSVGSALASEIKLSDSLGREVSILLATEGGQNLIGFRGLGSSSLLGRMSTHGMLLQASNSHGGSRPYIRRWNQNR